MLIVQWLRALRRKPAASLQEPPPDQPSLTAADDRIRAEHAALYEEARANWQPNQAFIDNGVRMHIAANDPAFPAKREAAVKAITAAMDKVAQAHGLTKKAKSWAKSGPLGTVSMHFQRSRYGFECYINLGFQPLSEASHGPWAQDDFVRLGRFFPTDLTASGEPGALIYLDVHEDAAALTGPMQVLESRALPWLLAHLENPDAWRAPFLTGPAAMD